MQPFLPELFLPAYRSLQNKQPPMQSQCGENAAVMDDVQVWPFTCYSSQKALQEERMMEDYGIIKKKREKRKKINQVKDSIVKKVLTIF